MKIKKIITETYYILGDVKIIKGVDTFRFIRDYRGDLLEDEYSLDDLKIIKELIDAVMEDSWK